MHYLCFSEVVLFGSGVINSPRLILASSSPRRLQLLKKIGYEPDAVYHPNIDESELSGELPIEIAKRLSVEKAKKCSAAHPDCIVLAADTVVCCGRRVLPKALTEDDAKMCVRMLSGRRHRVYTSVCGIYRGRIIVKCGENRIKMKNISQYEMDMLINSRQWYGKAGGYDVQGIAASFIVWASGGDTRSNIGGMPAHETYLILCALGLRPIQEVCPHIA